MYLLTGKARLMMFPLFQSHILVWRTPPLHGQQRGHRDRVVPARPAAHEAAHVLLFSQQLRCRLIPVPLPAQNGRCERPRWPRTIRSRHAQSPAHDHHSIRPLIRHGNARHFMLCYKLLYHKERTSRSDHDAGLSPASFPRLFCVSFDSCSICDFVMFDFESCYGLVRPD